MNKKLYFIIFLIILIIGIIVFYIYKTNQQNKLLLSSIENKIIFFYGEGCPHCANVEEFLKENGVEDKIQFEKKEVYNDRGNAKLLILVAKRKCGFKENEIGVPFLWDGENSKCTVGDQPIIDYFKEKIVSKI